MSDDDAKRAENNLLKLAEEMHLSINVTCAAALPIMEDLVAQMRASLGTHEPI